MPVKHALLVDDSKSARLVLRRLLEKKQLDVDLAESAEEALTYLKDNKPDVIFMDHMMPGIDGLEAAKLINNNPDTAGIPVIMCTSKEGDAFTADAKAHGAVDVICKPPSPDAVSYILSVLDGNAANDGGVITSETLDKNRENSTAPSPIEPMVDEAPVAVIPSSAVSGTANMDDLEVLIQSLVGTKLAEFSEQNDALNEKVSAFQNTLNTVQEQLGQLGSNIDEKISALGQSGEQVDTAYIDQKTEALRTEISKLIDGEISSLSDLMSSSSDAYAKQLKDIATKQAKSVFEAKIGDAFKPMEQKLKDDANNLKALEETLLERVNKPDSVSKEDVSAAHSMAKVSMVFGVLGIAAAGAVYFLLGMG